MLEKAPVNSNEWSFWRNVFGVHCLSLRLRINTLFLVASVWQEAAIIGFSRRNDLLPLPAYTTRLLAQPCLVQPPIIHWRAEYLAPR
jgi:hypothetical protein